MSDRMMPPSTRRRARSRPIICAVLAVLATACAPKGASIPYSELKHHITQGDVTSVVIGAQHIVATPTDDALARGAPAEWRSPALADPELIPLLEREKVVYDGDPHDAGPHPLQGLIILAAVFGLAGLLILFQRRHGMTSTARLGGAGVKAAENRTSDVRYSDVAGIDEAREELEEVVGFLRDPEKFARVGARAPKGVLLVGPPGTGKTLLARATAGEAGVPFYSVSGSAFVEMFVGVGARRVRELFKTARAHAPCIVFVDEIDAVGKGRGGPSANDEREHTLNQLLVEMDGFDSSDGIVVMAATNRPEILDKALLRPGRFDRRVAVANPDREGRRAILDVHVRRVNLSPQADLDVVARNTPGFAGADLANLLNEAALLAAREGCDRVEAGHLDAAIDRVLAGPQRKGRPLSPKEREIVAVHEAGHALVAERCATAERVRKISIVPRTAGALGFTQQLPDDRTLLQKDELVDRLRVLLGGRAAEEIIFGQVSTGASNDLERATELARRMVCEFGMSGVLGPVRLDAGGAGSVAQVLGSGISNASDATSADIDREMRVLLQDQASAARSILEGEREALNRISAALLEHESLEREDLLFLLRRHGDCMN